MPCLFLIINYLILVVRAGVFDFKNLPRFVYAPESHWLNESEEASC